MRIPGRFVAGIAFAVALCNSHAYGAALPFDVIQTAVTGETGNSLPGGNPAAQTATHENTQATDPDAAARPALPTAKNPNLPTIYLVGDSTVRNGRGDGANGQWGWGEPLADDFDPAKINFANRAIGGRSSRTYITEGRWDELLAKLKPGDFVILQFGHNDPGPLDDPARARGTLRGTGEETKEIFNPITKKQEVVHTYGWYMRKYIAEIRAKHATPILLTLTIRNIWTAGADGRQRIERDMGYDAAIRQLASDQQVLLVDMANYEADHLEAAGPDKTALLFPLDHTHSSAEGAELNAQIFVRALRATQSPLIGYLAQGIQWPEIAVPTTPAAPASIKSADGAAR